ncbi:MAG: hypothetical protein ACTSO9_02920 [Candidatus Helarchaeota archaeon]
MPNYERQKIKYCTPTCRFLRCQQRAIGNKFKKNGRLVVACNFAPGALCEAYKCKYSFCSKYKMASDGRCNLNFNSQKKLQKKYEPKDEEPIFKTKKPLKMKSKILKKLRDYDEF